MAWEARGSRGNRRYYYTARRVGARVVKRYHGHGVLAELAQRLDAEARARRSAESADFAVMQERLAHPRALMDDLDHHVSRLVEATFLAAGYHRHNYGPWRRRRRRE